MLIRLWINCCIAAAASRLDDEPSDESEEVALPLEEDEVEDVALALVVPSPVTPSCDKASSMELISPPPCCGGGGGGGASELRSDVLVESA